MKPLAINLIYRGKVTNPMSNVVTVGFQINGDIKRSEFAVGIDFPEMVISDIVHIKADGEFIQQ